MLNFSTGYTIIICSKFEHIPYNLIFTTEFNDFSILISLISWDYLNVSLAMNMLAKSQYQPRLSSITNVAPGVPANQIAVITSN